MTNTTVDWKEYNSLNTNSLNPFSQLLYSPKMIISKSQIIIKYWRNTADYKIYIRFSVETTSLWFCGIQKQYQSMFNMKYNTPI